MFIVITGIDGIVVIDAEGGYVMACYQDFGKGYGRIGLAMAYEAIDLSSISAICIRIWDEIN